MNSSGPISLAGTTAGQSIQIENGGNGTTQISLNDAAVRSLAGVPSGAIVMPTNFYGKANQFSLTISSDTTNANLASLATAAGWNGTSALVATINNGIVVSANSTGTPGLTVSGSFPGGVSIINNGFIVGMGGRGGNGQPGGGGGSAGSAGGTALSVSSAVSITNNGTVAGGGGGGGGGPYTQVDYGCYVLQYGGGGGGGGRSGRTDSSGGSGGGGSGGSGGPGGVGTFTGGGSGAANGGDWGSAGARNPFAGLNGGAGGACTSGNSNITWTVTGTRIGALN